MWWNQPSRMSSSPFKSYSDSAFWTRGHTSRIYFSRYLGNSVAKDDSQINLKFLWKMSCSTPNLLVASYPCGLSSFEKVLISHQPLSPGGTVNSGFFDVSTSLTTDNFFEDPSLMLTNCITSYQIVCYQILWLGD